MSDYGGPPGSGDGDPPGSGDGELAAPGDGGPAAPGNGSPVAGGGMLDPCQRSALISWLAFTATFATVRGVTYSIRAGRGPFRNLSLGGEHVHH